MARPRTLLADSRLSQRKLWLWAAGFALAGIAVVLAVRAASPMGFEAEVSTRQGNAAVISLAGASGGQAIRFAAPSPTPEPGNSAGLPVRLTFYYPWFPETWGKLSDPFTNFHPSAGWYSSDSSLVVANHIQHMTYAGFDGAIASWWGPGTHAEATRIPALLNNSANSSHGKNLKWGLYYERESVADPTSAQLRTDLQYLKDRYTSHANFLRINGAPVLFVFEDPADGCAMASRWAEANAGLGFYVVLKVFPGYAQCPQQPANWHQYAPANPRDSQAGHSYTVSPGFWLKGEAAPRLVRDPARFAADLDAMVSSKAPLQLVTTYNEWGEGTAVEPATEWSSTDGYGTYLNILHSRLNSGR